MRRHARFHTTLLALALAVGCVGTEGNVFLDRSSSTADGGSSFDSMTMTGPDTGFYIDSGVEDASGDDDGSTEPDGAIPDGSWRFDGSIDRDGSIPDGSWDFDGSIGFDGSIDLDGSIPDGSVPGVDCSQNPPVFPSFNRFCVTARDCAIGAVQIDCCGSMTVTGIAAFEEQRFAAAAATCNAQFPDCGCPALPTRADDGTTEFNRGPEIVQCVSNMCQTTFPADPTVCGGNLTCDPFTTICVATTPVGPSTQYSCEPIPTGCEYDRTCSCAAASLCNAPFDTCVDAGPNQISCECLQCR